MEPSNLPSVIQCPALLSVAVADFNGDGNPDIAVTNYSETSAGLSLLLGNGDGTFRSAINYSLNGIASGPLVAADFNGDGKPDLLVGNVILLGNGDGTFQAPLPISNSPSFQTIVVGDFNGDGKLDVVIANPFLQIAFGNGDGTFQPFSPIMNGTFVGSPLVLGDFNGDGNLDLVVSVNNGTSVLLGNGDGTFQSPISLPFAGNLIAASDFNGDGIADLAIANSNSNIVSLLQGNGDGTFHLALSYTTTGSARVPGHGRLQWRWPRRSRWHQFLPSSHRCRHPARRFFGRQPHRDGWLSANRRDRRAIRRSVASDRRTRWNSAERSHRQLHGAFDRGRRGVEHYHCGDQYRRCRFRQRHRQWGRGQLRGDRNLQRVHCILLAHQQYGRQRDRYGRHAAVHLDRLAIPQASRSHRSGLGREPGVWCDTSRSPRPPAAPACCFLRARSLPMLPASPGVSVIANATVGSYTVTASAGGQSASFSLSNTTIKIVFASGGTPQSAPVGTTFPIPLQVTVLDSSGNPVPNTSVNFSAPQTGASATFPFGTRPRCDSNAAGVANVTATANNTPGTYTVTASVSGAGSTFSVSFHFDESVLGERRQQPQPRPRETGHAKQHPSGISVGECLLRRGRQYRRQFLRRLGDAHECRSERLVAGGPGQLRFDQLDRDLESDGLLRLAPERLLGVCLRYPLQLHRYRRRRSRAGRGHGAAIRSRPPTPPPRFPSTPKAGTCACNSTARTT